MLSLGEEILITGCMDDKKVIIENKSILYICISIIIGFSILSISLFLTSKNDINRYEMISTNEKIYMILKREIIGESI